MNIYTGAMGMISFQGKLEVAGNNISNAKTDGFKADRETFKVFEETFARIKEGGRSERLGPLHDEVHVDQIEINFEQGPVLASNRKLDFMLEDKAESRSFFVVQRNQEPLLTRSGRFEIDEAGYLSTPNGAYVLDRGGERIQLDPSRDISVSDSGDIRYSDNKELAGSIQIQQIREENLGFLERSQGPFFKVMTAEELASHFGTVQEMLAQYDRRSTLQKIFKGKTELEEIARTGRVDVLEPFTGMVRSNALEQSNVDLSYELTELMVAQKGFSASQKVTAAYDRINEKDANELGR